MPTKTDSFKPLFFEISCNSLPWLLDTPLLSESTFFSNKGLPYTALLARAKQIESKSANLGKNLLNWFWDLWVFLYEEGIEPTNKGVFI